MVPAQRRELSEQRFLAGATDAECVNGTVEVSTVKQDDRGSDEVERGGARLLVFDAAIPEAPEPVKRDRSGKSVPRLTLVQLGGDIFAQSGIFEPAQCEQGTLDTAYFPKRGRQRVLLTVAESFFRISDGVTTLLRMASIIGSTSSQCERMSSLSSRCPNSGASFP